MFASFTFFPRESRKPSEFIDPPPSFTTSIVGSISVESLGYWKFLCLLCLGKQFGRSEKGEKQIEKGFFIRCRIVREAFPDTARGLFTPSSLPSLIITFVVTSVLCSSGFVRGPVQPSLRLDEPSTRQAQRPKPQSFLKFI